MADLVKGNKFYDALQVAFNIAKKYNEPIKSDEEWATFIDDCNILGQGKNQLTIDLILAVMAEKQREETSNG